MKITSMNTISFEAQKAEAQVVDKNKKGHKKEKKYVDPLANWPMRGLGYTNDIGVAISEIAPTASRLFWVPSLMYFGADVYDKYKNKGNKYDPNGPRAFSQAVFQAFASIILPATFGHIGQSTFSQIDKYRGEKISTNAKEQTLRFIKHHAAEHDIFNTARNKEDIVDNFVRKFEIFSKDKKEAYKNKNIFVKTYDKLLANCKRGAIANTEPEKLKAFAKREFTKVLESCTNKEALGANLDKQIFKLKAWKSLGSFAVLLLTVKPIDMFTENIIIKKCVKPQMDYFNKQHSKMENFAQHKQEEKAPEKTA